MVRSRCAMRFCEAETRTSKKLGARKAGCDQKISSHHATLLTTPSTPMTSCLLAPLQLSCLILACIGREKLENHRPEPNKFNSGEIILGCVYSLGGTGSGSLVGASQECKRLP